MWYESGMRDFFAPNLERRGRIARGVGGGILLAGGILTAFAIWWAGLLLAISGIFALYEATRGWCLLRACGIKTRM
jgi:hypothetical protein